MSAGSVCRFTVLSFIYWDIWKNIVYSFLQNKKQREWEEIGVKILFYDTKKYDKDSFEKALKEYPDISLDYLDTNRQSCQGV